VKFQYLVVLLAILFAPISSSAYTASRCSVGVKKLLYKQGYSTQVDFYSMSNPMKYSFKWKPKDKWTPCQQSDDSYTLTCGSIAKLIGNSQPTSPLIYILSTSGERFSAVQKIGKIMKCSVRTNGVKKSDVDGKKAFIFTYDYSAIFLYEFSARSIGKRTFFLREDNIGEETPPLLPPPEF
jgi:hypothetical protein